MHTLQNEITELPYSRIFLFKIEKVISDSTSNLNSLVEFNGGGDGWTLPFHFVVMKRLI